MTIKCTVYLIIFFFGCTTNKRIALNNCERNSYSKMKVDDSIFIDSLFCNKVIDELQSFVSNDKIKMLYINKEFKVMEYYSSTMTHGYRAYFIVEYNKDLTLIKSKDTMIIFEKLNNILKKTSFNLENSSVKNKIKSILALDKKFSNNF